MTRVHIIGAGSPRPTPVRFGSCYVAEVGGERLMMDCGPASTWKLIRAGMNPGMIDTVFFTHHHYDHDVDYPCFVLNRWGHHDFGQLNPLQVYGPTFTEELTDKLFNADHGAWAPDWISRTKHPASLAHYEKAGGPLPRQGPKVDARNIEAGAVIEGEGWKVTSAHAEHFQPYLDSLAYRLDTPQGSVVFAGDTEPCESVLELSKDADLLITMCWDFQESMDQIADYRGLMGTVGAGRLAQDAGVKRLLLSHLTPKMAAHGALEAGIAEVASVYDGEILFADELMTLDIGDSDQGK